MLSLDILGASIAQNAAAPLRPPALHRRRASGRAGSREGVFRER